jgi:hypothetical protein
MFYVIKTHFMFHLMSKIFFGIGIFFCRVVMQLRCKCEGIFLILQQPR